jgi:endonuclease-3
MAKTSSKLETIRKQRVDKILPLLKRAYPTAKCSLNHESPLQLLVATILSAQSTDDRVNIVTKDLFKKYKSAKAFADVTPEELENDIRSTGFYRNKTKSIRAMAAALLADHGGEVPKTMEELTKLAGVGRKTANVVLGNAFDINVGVVVDTHVTRLSQRLGLTKHTDAVKIELDLIPIVPQKDWTLFSHLLIYHGRAICQARKPKCGGCVLKEHCPSAAIFLKADAKKALLKKPAANRSAR